MRVLFNDSARQVRALRSRIGDALDEVVDSGWYIHGRQHDAFEAEFARYCGVSECVGVGNGTDALEIALRAVGCGPGSEVITVANAGMYTTAACVAVGSVPVFVDIDPSTLLLSVDLLEPLLSEDTRAVVVTHLYGCMADVEAVVRLVRPQGIAVIEDCAQAHGARHGDRVAGSFGDLATFSFYPTKNLGALGDGGAILTSDSDLAARVRSLRQYGWSGKYDAAVPGGRNSRLDELQASVLRVKLPLLDEWNERRRSIVARYREAASGGPLALAHRPGQEYVAHLCVGTHPRRDEARAALLALGVDTAVHYPIPDHLQTALADVPWRAGNLAATERASQTVLSLPCYPELADSEIEHVANALRELA